MPNFKERRRKARTKTRTFKPAKREDLRKERVSAQELKKVFIKAQQLFATFPQLTDTQCWEYFMTDVPWRQSFRKVFHRLVSRRTTVRDFMDIIRIHTTVTELQNNDYTEEQEMGVLQNLKHDLVDKRKDSQ